MDSDTLRKLEEIRHQLEADQGDCPPGRHVCPKTGKCVPIGSGDGKGPRRDEDEDFEEGYHPVKEIMANLLGGFTNKMLQHGLLTLKETKDIEAYVKKIADRKYKNWSA
jgi:hypothetical protein